MPKSKPIVRVWWVDSEDPPWTDEKVWESIDALDKWAKDSIGPCVSIGILYYKDRNHLVLVGCCHEGEVSRPVKLPLSAVRKIEELGTQEWPMIKWPGAD